MKNINILLILAFILIGENSAEAEGIFIKESPWQSMLTVLDKHGIDTSGINVTTTIKKNTLLEISTDLARTFRVRDAITWTQTDEVMIGEVISTYLQKKYQNRRGEKYDYYKVQYSVNEDEFFSFLERNPTSKHLKEMYSKGYCLRAWNIWSSEQSNDEMYRLAYEFSKTSVECNYEGFISLWEKCKIYENTVDEWSALMRQRNALGYKGYDEFVNFKESHPNLLSGYCSMINDSIDNIAWIETTTKNTISAYQEYLSNFSQGTHASDAERKIADYLDFMMAKSLDSHASYAEYCNIHPDGDSVSTAMLAMKDIEEPDWNEVERNITHTKKGKSTPYEYTKALKALDDYIDKYPNGGYYISEAAKLQHEMIESIQGASISDNSFLSYGRCSSPYYGIVFLGNICLDTAKKIVITLRNKETGKVFRRAVNQSDYWECKLPNGEYSIVASCRGVQDYVGKFSVSGRLYYSSFYIETWMDYNGKKTPTFPSILGKPFDKEAAKRIEKAFFQCYYRENQDKTGLSSTNRFREEISSYLNDN